MHPSRLTHIAFLFPHTTAEGRAFFGAIAQLLRQIPNAAAQPDRIAFTPSNPPGALPSTSLELADVPFPKVVLHTEQPIDIHAGPFRLHSTGIKDENSPPLPPQTDRSTDLLTADELLARLGGHVTRIDHTGVNLPTMVERSVWDNLVQQLAAVSALYRYPTGEEWPFVLPTTDEEFRSDIRRFVAGREPKFELVYDEWAPHAVLQFSIGTDLTRRQAEALFPEPYGVAFPDLGDIFRTVYLAHPWPQLTIRFDLNYEDIGEPSEWDTGEWLVQAGGRMR